MTGAAREVATRRGPCTAPVLLNRRDGTVLAQLTWQAGLVRNPRGSIRRVHSC